MTEIERLEWIGADWGTSNLRVWAMGPRGVLAHKCSDAGMGKLAKGEFEPALKHLVAPWLSDRVVPIIVCGMAGARQGWQEAPYRAVPCSAIGAQELMRVVTAEPQYHVFIVPGLRQDLPADVMRGEETQIAGALALTSETEGVFCLPGTHSKWVRVSAGNVVSFQTFMTGEAFALFSSHSVLRHGMVGDGWDETAFDNGVQEAKSRPEQVAAQLFGLRAQGLLHGLSPSAARSRLSGLLIGAELVAGHHLWIGHDVTLIGTSALSNAYQRALLSFGVAVRSLDATACTLAGLTSIAQPQLENLA